MFENNLTQSKIKITLKKIHNNYLTGQKLFIGINVREGRDCQKL